MTGRSPITAGSADPWQRSGGRHRPIIVAHRGASAFEPDNSAAAFEAAMVLGADAVETDIRRSRDGVFVCHHDPVLRLGTARDGVVAEMSWEEIQAAKSGSCMTLESTLGLVACRCGLLLDLKLTGPRDIEQFAGRLRAFGPPPGIAIGARSLAIASALRSALPATPLVALFGNPDDHDGLVSLGNVWWRLWEPEVAPGRLAALRGLGLPVLVMAGQRGQPHPGDIDDGRLGHVFGHDVAGVMLNDPRAARQAMARRLHPSRDGTPGDRA